MNSICYRPGVSHRASSKDILILIHPAEQADLRHSYKKSVYTVKKRAVGGYQGHVDGDEVFAPVTVQ
jgi:hypothetical protein